MSGAPSPPVIVTGMHRSGTSLVASFLGALGVHLGDRLLAADRQNPRGYFEDADFVELQWRMLAGATPAGDGGHRDWGWTESERLDRGRFARHAEAARGLVAARAGRSGLWGWKDPRTSVLLDFWDEILAGGALYVLLYRFPWEVADSIQRVGGGEFLDNPEYAFRIWAFYNRQLLDFHRRHADRCVLASANAVVRDAGRFVALLRDKLGLAVTDAPLDSVWQPGLFGSFPADDPLIALTLATSPDCAELLAALDAAADLPATGLWNDLGTPGGAPLRPRLVPGEQVDLSVVIPCYDYGQLLVDAVASVERNAPPGSELLVVNDGSTQPRTLEVLDVLRRAGYRILDQENGGLAAARNRGVREARGRCILPLDADNRMVPDFAAAAIRALDAAPQLGVVYGDRIDFGARSGRLRVPEFDLDTLLWSNFIDACAIYRREVWAEGDGYDAGAAVWEDWELWISAAERGWGFARLDQPGFEYRVRPNSMLVVAERDGRFRAACDHVYRKHRALYVERFEAVLRAGRANLLVVAEDATALRAARDRLQVEIDLLAAASAATSPVAPAAPVTVQELMERHAAESRREAAVAAVAEQASALDEAQRDAAALRVEREALYRELAAWQERAAFTEGTRAFRLRDRLLRWKNRRRR